MAENSGIQWTTHTFNPVRGCEKVSPGCDHCYAEAMSKRNPAVLGEWGSDGTRIVASESYWTAPEKWDRAAAAAGERHRVFCASLADVFEDRPEWVRPRSRLFALIDATPNLDWLLLTKRPENVARLMPPLVTQYVPEAGEMSYVEGVRPNVWLGTSVEDQQRADERIPHLLRCPAAVRFLSVEPLLGPVDLTRWMPRFVPWANAGGPDECCHGYAAGVPCPDCTPRLDWVIVGGESGPHSRPCEVAWVRSIVAQCQAAGVACFVKQLGSHVVDSERGGMWPAGTKSSGLRALLRDKKGGDWSEWPNELRAREFPSVVPAEATGWRSSPETPRAAAAAAENAVPRISAKPVEKPVVVPAAGQRELFGPKAPA